MAVVARHPELVGVDSLVWVEPATKGRPETVEVLSDAALRVATYLGGGWRVAAALRAIPRPCATRRTAGSPGIGTTFWVAGPRVSSRTLETGEVSRRVRSARARALAAPNKVGGAT